MFILKNSGLFFILFFTVFISSCKRPKTTSEAVPPIFAPCVVEEIDFTYFTSKAKLHYKDPKNDQKTNVNIRIKKDSVIWISVNAAAGFEAFRIMITTDSIHILNRLSNEYILKDFVTLSNDVGIQLNYKMLQSLILGNLMNPKSAEDKVIKSDSSYCIFKQVNGIINITNHVQTRISKVEKVEITNATDLLTINYLKFVPLGNTSFASENEIILKHKSEETEDQSTIIHIEHNKTEFPDKELNFPFNVPNKFERR